MQINTISTDSQNTTYPQSAAIANNPHSPVQATAAIANNLFTSQLQALSLEPDYFSFQTKVLTFLEKNNPHDLKQWKSFCHHLNLLQIPKSEKLLLLQAASQCIHNPMEPGELAQLLVLTTHLKSVSGVRLFKALFSAQIPYEERCIRHYITACRLLIELHDQPALFKCLKDNLPHLSQLITVLQEMEAAYLTSKYPERDIEETISRFGQCDDLIQFPLSSEELVKIKAEYLEVKACIQTLKKTPPLDITEDVKKYAAEWRDQHNLSAKHHLIALIAETVRRIYKIAPYDTQLLSFLALLDTPEKLKGRIAQIKTGEGKSTMIAMLSVFMACQNHFVDVITSSSYLAVRDCEKYAPFYRVLGLSTSQICALHPEQHHFHSQILYGTNTDFEFALLRDGLSQAELRYSMLNGKLQHRTFDAAIIDEVDNLFLDTARNSALLSIPGHEEWSWIYGPILEFAMNPANQIGLMLLPKQTIEELRHCLTAQLPEQYHKQIQALSDQKLKKWFRSALIALYKKKEKRDYIVKNSIKPYAKDVDAAPDIAIVDYKNTGRVNEGCQWGEGIHQFLQAKHQLKITPESLTAASLAHPTYFGLYKCIMGVTGTMGEAVEREEIQKIYEVDSFDVPPHFPSQRINWPSSILPNSTAQHEAILQQVEEMRKQGRPVLILFESVEESDAFSQSLLLKGFPHQLLNETQREDEDYLIARAGDAGMITIATNTAGRGTDILLSPQSKEAGGLHVILAFYPTNLRVEGQGLGRAARQGQPGSGCLILNVQDENIQSLIKGNEEAAKDIVFPILNSLRTEQIKQESHSRYLCSQKEKIYFEKLQQFFRQMREVQQMFQTSDFKEQFIKECKACPPMTSAQKEDQWKPFQEMFQTLLEKQSAGNTVDWTGLFDLFHRTYISCAQRQWALFYNKLHEGTDSDDISAIQKQVEELSNEARSKLDNYLINPRENALNILRSI